MKNLSITLLFLLFFLPGAAFASLISLRADKNTFSLGEEFLVQVILDTKDLKVNALEGTIVYPSEFLELKDIRDGNSSVNFWIEKPHLLEDGKIAFSGITAGGFSGPDRFLLGLVFKSKKIGEGSIIFNDIQVLENDGQGTKIENTETPFNFSIIGGDGSSNGENLLIKDNEMPENFTPFFATDPSIYNGQHFLVFSTVDKGSGIDHYEVGESFWPFAKVAYHVAESPYLLQDQTLKSKIYVKAVDKNGNSRVVTLAAQNKLALLEQFLFFAIILSICIWLIRKIWRKFQKR